MNIIHGSCFDLADARAFDSVITDPPYSEHVHKSATSHSGKRGARHRELGFDHLSPELRKHVAHLMATAKRWSVVFSDIEGYRYWIDDCDAATYIRGIPWTRWSMPQLSGNRPPQGAEMVGLFWGTQKGRKSWNGPGNLTHLSHTCLRGEGKHKAEKPLDQLLDLVAWFTNPGDHVLDPCAGSGTTGLACRLLGREFTGYEIDAEWAAKAQERIARDKLSERDEERYARWLESQKAAMADTERRKKHTAKVREKLEHITIQVYQQEDPRKIAQLAKEDIDNHS